MFRRRMAYQISFPRPEAPSKATMITIPRAIMIVWLMPIMMDGLAKGSWILNRVWSEVEP